MAALTSSMAVQPIAQQEISNATAMAAAEEMLHFGTTKRMLRPKLALKPLLINNKYSFSADCSTQSGIQN